MLARHSRPNRLPSARRLQSGMETREQRAKPLRLRYKIAYGVGHLQNDLTAAMWFSFMLVYFIDVVGLSTKEAGALLLLGQASGMKCCIAAPRPS